MVSDKQNQIVSPDQVLPPNLFVLPVNHAVVFPTLMAPIMVQVPRFIATVEESISRQRIIGLLIHKTGEVSDTTQTSDLYTTGVVVKVLKRFKLPDGSVNILVHSIKRFKAKSFISEQPHFIAQAEYLDEVVEKSTDMDALSRSVIASVKKLAETNPFFTDEMRMAMINAPGPGVVSDIVAFALALPREDAQVFLETTVVKERFEKLLVYLQKEQNVSDLQKKIQEDVNGKISTMQREFFLKEQLKVIKKELGIEEEGKDKNKRSFKERIDAAGMPEDVKKVAMEELEKFETLSESSPEYNISRNYLETICSLPWSNETLDNLDLIHAQNILDEDHYGLSKVKDRIIEFLAVRKLNPKSPKGSIICLVGPPGVGKTSVGKSIAKTMGRSFYRFSLGGMRDEAEIKGHRRTYVGALPGKFIQAMKRAGTKNPVIMLDEIDKLGNSYQGDPASALLEVLDSEQNSQFLDHYLDLHFDLSKVLFVATANNLSTIPAPLLDRMEIIEIPGYTLEEKEEIATRYVIPKVLESNGLKPSQLRIEKAALKKIMNDYAREPGLRVLQQMIEKITRKAVAKIVKVSDRGLAQRPIWIQVDDLHEYLGPKRFYNELAERITSPGVVTGLAWTAMGGDILFIEAQNLPGSGQLKLTGQMGEVMTESAAIAWTFVKKKILKEKLHKPEYFKEHDFHLHIPAGAIPKDGPSAGVTMAAALYSLITGRKSKQKIAMTGELSLIGKVLPVGGIKEKLLAAKRAGVTTIIMPKLNEKDVNEVPEYALKDLTIHYVSHVDDVLNLVIEEPVRKIELKRTGASRILKKKVKKVTAKRQSRLSEKRS